VSLIPTVPTKDSFLYPLLYTGPTSREQKDMTHVFGRTLVFKRDTLSAQPGPLEGQRYADVTEHEGRTLVKRWPDLFRWPDGTQLGPQVVSRDEYDDLTAKYEALALRVAALEGPAAPATDAPKKERAPAKKKAAPEAAPPPAAPATDAPATQDPPPPPPPADEPQE
jgi:hypothetical protein